MARFIKLLAGTRSVQSNAQSIGADAFFIEMAPGEVDALTIDCARWLGTATLSSVIDTQAWITVTFTTTEIAATLTADGAAQSATLEIVTSDARTRVITLTVGQSAASAPTIAGGGGGGAGTSPVPQPSDADVGKPLRAVTGRTYRWADPIVLHIDDFGAVGDGVADDTPAWLAMRAAMTRATLLAGTSRIIAGVFGAKRYRMTAQMDLRDAATSNNKWRIEGAGQRDTELFFDYTSGGAAVSLPGIYGGVRDLTITASAARKAGAAGVGLLLDGSVIGAVTTQLGNRLERVRVTEQPGDGFSIWRQEQLTKVDCLADGNIGRGFSLDALTSANTSIRAEGCRATSNGLNGWRIANTIASSFINCYSLYNLTAAGSLTGLDRCEVRTTGTTRGLLHLNWDVESELDLPYGFVYAGPNHSLQAGYYRVGWTAGASSSEVIYLSACTNSSILHPDIRGRNATDVASRGISIDSVSTGNTIQHAATFPNVTTALLQGNRQNVFLSAGEIAGALRRQTTSYTIPTAHTPLTAEGEIVLTLTGNATINAPSGTASSGSTLVIWLVQDATGGRTVTWNATYQFGATAWSNTGNTANRVARVEFALQNAQWRIVSYRAWEA